MRTSAPSARIAATLFSGTSATGRPSPACRAGRQHRRRRGRGFRSRRRPRRAFAVPARDWRARWPPHGYLKAPTGCAVSSFSRTSRPLAPDSAKAGTSGVLAATPRNRGRAPIDRPEAVENESAVVVHIAWASSTNIPKKQACATRLSRRWTQRLICELFCGRLRQLSLRSHYGDTDRAAAGLICSGGSQRFSFNPGLSWRRAVLVLAAAPRSSASPRQARRPRSSAPRRRLHPRRFRQRGALRLRDAGRQAHRRGAGGRQGRARQDGHHAGRRRADRIRLAHPRPQGRPLRHHRRRHVHQPEALRARSPSPNPPTASARPCSCPKGNPKGIKDYASSLKNNGDLKLAVMAGAVEAGYAKDAGVGRPARRACPTSRAWWRPCRPAAPTRAALTALSIADMA